MIKRFTVYIIFAAFFVFNFSEVFSQNGREVQSSGTVQNLHCASFINSNVGVASGNAVTIIRTGNGGTNRTAHNSETPNHLFGAFLINSNTNRVSGNVSVILKTTNSRINCTSYTGNSVYRLHHLQFLNANYDRQVFGYKKNCINKIIVFSLNKLNHP